jgi:hypothetical protein
MPYMVTMLNDGGILDREPANTGQESATIAIRMIRDAGELCPGDKIVISAIDDGQIEILKSRLRPA